MQIELYTISVAHSSELYEVIDAKVKWWVILSDVAVLNKNKNWCTSRFQTKIIEEPRILRQI